jgi:hypothetical protein
VRAWQWLLLLSGIGVLAYVGLVLALVLAGRRGDARALAGFVPDCVVAPGMTWCPSTGRARRSRWP